MLKNSKFAIDILCFVIPAVLHVPFAPISTLHRSSFVLRRTRRIVSWKLASLSLSLSLSPSLSLSLSLSPPYLISAAISTFSGELVPLEQLPPEEAAAVAAEREKWM